jgi:hypothetical protein
MVESRYNTLLRKLMAALTPFLPAKRGGQRQVKIDLVTENPQTGIFSLVLVEVGPWESGTAAQQLRRLQERLYDCIDAAVDGQVAGRFPASRGRPIRIQLDTYDIPASIIRPHFETFAAHIATWDEVQRKIRTHRHVQSLEFEYNPRAFDGQQNPS